MRPGFSERTFEFCFNAEYCRLNAALLATHPYIPSQNKEKDLGYDIEFRIQQGGYTVSLFFQHKVSSFAESRAGRNAKFYDAHGGPYFRFPVDNDQHNTLRALSYSKGNAFYCAPCFHLRPHLEAHFRSDSIGSNAILLNPLDVGEIVDDDLHNVTYEPSGGSPVLHSDIRKFKESYTAGRERPPRLRKATINNQYIEELSEELVLRTMESRFRNALTPQVMRQRPIERVQILLGRVYQVSWFLLP